MPQAGLKRLDDGYEAYLAEAARIDPTWATQVGIHDYDDRLTRDDDASYEARRAFALRWREQLRSWKPAAEERLDHAIWLAGLEVAVFDCERRDVRAEDPSRPIAAISVVHTMLIKDYAPLERRVADVLRRLEQFPAVFYDAKQNLKRPPRVWTRMALDDLAGSADFFKEIPHLCETVLLKDTVVKSRLDAALALASEAVETYRAFLEKEVYPRSDGVFAVGKEVYDFYLRTAHFLPYDSSQLKTIGESEFSKTRVMLEELARRIDPSKTAKKILEEMKKDHPRSDELVEVYRRETERARRFLIDRNVVAIPEGEKLEIIETPIFERSSIPYAAYQAPGPLDEARIGHFYVTPVSKEASSEEQERQLAGHNSYDIPGTVFHEAYPGHHLQFVYAKAVPSKIRRLNDSPLLSEGWGLYCEELAYETGYFRNDRERLMQLDWRLHRAARIILDVGLHTGQMTYGEAVRFLMEHVYLERPHAEGSVNAYTRSPTYFMSYLVGMRELQRIREECRERLGPLFSLREFHERVLSTGNVPPALIGEELERTWR